MYEPKRIGLLGASFDTGNMGVSALAESAIKCILHRWPDAEITLLDSGRVPGEHRLRVGDRNVNIKELPIRFCRNIFLENHFAVLCLYALLFKVFRGEKFSRFCAQRNASLNRIVQIDMVADITGGDSFSDIYGMRRFVLGFLRKWLVLLFNKDLIMLPQTYGPYRRLLAKAMARYILNRASVVYSRDQEGIEYANALLNNRRNGKVRFAPDVAFVLDAREPRHLDIEPSADVRARGEIVVGLNISGLLFNGGYSRNNMFGLRSNYRGLIYAVIEMLLKDERVSILLVPHVFLPAGSVECDPDACAAAYESFRKEHRNHIFLVQGKYDQGEIKHVIGMCDFFVGSRMHSCIAAMSQCIPAVGIAYSRKFHGVFSSVGLSDCVSDARTCTEDELLEKIGLVFERRELIRKQLQSTIPSIQRKVLDMFKGLEL
jgi:polysaccharide pyruvyl transferase WcaK-like protein